MRVNKKINRQLIGGPGHPISQYNCVAPHKLFDMTKRKANRIAKRTGQLSRNGQRPAPQTLTINRNRRRQKRQRTKVVETGRNGLGLGMAACTRDYLKALENPFSGASACIPSEFNFPSLKQSVMAYGTFATGAGGVGWVSVIPFACPYVGTGSGSYWPNPIGYTSGGFTGTTFTNYVNPNVGTSSCNSPYLSNFTDTAVGTRLVGCGLRVRNVTPLLNRGGSLIGLEELNHQSLSLASFSASTMMLEDIARPMSSTSDEWQSVVYHPQAPQEINWYYAFQAYPPTYVTGPYDTDFLGFLATSNAVTPQTYEWQVVCAFEAKGTLVHGLSPSLSDPSGFAAVQNATSSVFIRQPQSGERAAWVARTAGMIAGMATSFYEGYAGTRRNLLLAPNRAGPLITEMEVD